MVLPDEANAKHIDVLRAERAAGERARRLREGVL